MSKVTKQKATRDERRFSEAQKAHMKAFGYTFIEDSHARVPEHASEQNTVEKVEKLSNQLPILEIKKDFVKITFFALFTFGLLFALKYFKIDFQSIKGFISL